MLLFQEETLFESNCMIPASDYEELVINCQDLILKDATRIIGELVNTINTNPSYAAMTVMALYKAAIIVDFSSEELDNMVRLAEESCSAIKVTDYRRFYKRFMEFDKAKADIELAESKFFVSTSTMLH